MLGIFDDIPRRLQTSNTAIPSQLSPASDALSLPALLLSLKACVLIFLPPSLTTIPESGLYVVSDVAKTRMCSLSPKTIPIITN